MLSNLVDLAIPGSPHKVWEEVVLSQGSLGENFQISAAAQCAMSLPQSSLLK